MRKGRLKYGLSLKQLAGLLVFVIVAIAYNSIAYEYGQETNDPLELKKESGVLPPLIPYRGGTVDKLNRNVGPFDKQNVASNYYRHWLGTDALGRDVLAGIIYGSHVALKVGFWSSLFSLLIGVFLGYLSGFFGDKELKLNRGDMLFFIFMLLITLFYAFYSATYLRYIFVLIPILVFWFLSKRVRPYDAKTKAFPLDLFVFRIVEIFKAIPDLFLILVTLALFQKPGIWNVIIVITIIRWPNITHHLRSEILKIKNADFIKAAKAIGQKNINIFINDLAPLTFSPIIVLTAFGFASAVLIESTLSFLGIGVPLDMVTWGSLLREARTNFGSWWLVLFPGLMIYFTISLFNSIGNTISDHLQNKKNIEFE